MTPEPSSSARSDEGQAAYKTYLASVGDDYLRGKIGSMRALISRAESNIVNWQAQLDDALAEADRRWGTDG